MTDPTSADESEGDWSEDPLPPAGDAGPDSDDTMHGDVGSGTGADAAGQQDEAPPEAEQEGEAVPPPLYYGSTDEFLREYLRHMYSRPINGRSRVWAARWWEYAEAVARLEALWRAWEHLRQDASTGASVWWRDHADHHMSVLMDPEGPFAGADPNDMTNQARRGDPLPYAQPPAELFPDVRASTSGKSSPGDTSPA